MTTTHPIASDDEATWPAGALSLLEARLDALRAYHEERRRIERLAERDSFLKYNPPANAWKDAHDATIVEVDAAIRDAHLLGYHCTRLADDEVATVLRDGMRVAGADLVADRVRARVAAGDITSELGDTLIAKGCGEHTGKPDECGARKGMIWFCFSRECLREEGGVYRLFTQWGGEITYWAHDEDGDVAASLRRLGSACIIETAVPVREVEAYGPIGERLVRCYLHRRDVETGRADAWEGHVRVPLGGDLVRRIVRRRDPDFVTLTGCDAWSDPVT